MARKIKLIAVDMDGTCLDNRHRVPERNLWALEEAIKAGILVVPATGRALKGYPVPIRKLPGIRYVITSNGARVTDVQSGETIRECLIPWHQAVDFLAEIEKYRVWVCAHMDGTCIDESLVPFVHRRLFYHGDFKESRLVGRLGEVIRREKMGVEKFQIFFQNRAAMEAAHRLTEREPDFDFAFSSRWYAEIPDRRASKGSALTALCSHLGLDRSEVMAIGDSENDLSMFRAAGHAVAMGNAQEKILQAAGEVTGSNVQGGLARAVMGVVRKQG